MKVLLDMGADHTLKDNLGQTAMCEAVRNNHARVMDVMLARGPGRVGTSVSTLDRVQLSHMSSDGWEPC